MKELTAAEPHKIPVQNQDVKTKFQDGSSYNTSILQYAVIAFGIVVILLSWGITLHQLKKNQTSLLKGLAREQKNLSSLFAENLYQILEKKQPIEMLAINWLENHSQSLLSDLNNFIYTESAFTRIVLYDLKGETFYQSSPRRQGQEYRINIRDLLVEMKNHRNTKFLNIYGDSSRVPWQIPLFFPLVSGEEIKGIMLLELDIGYLLNLLQDINLGKTGRVTINNDKNITLASFENGGLTVNSSSPRPLPLSSQETHHLTRVQTYSGFHSYQIAYANVHDYPLIITISQELDDFLSEFFVHKKRLIWILVTLSSLCFLGLYLLVKLINKKHEYLSELANSYYKNSELIEKLEQEHQASQKAASVDSLTGLYNRRLFIFQAQKKLSAAKRNRLAYAVLFVDLDRFKTINDTLGHRIGDLLLKEVANRLSTSTRESDVVARFGGDEFVVMLSELATEKNITPIVEKIINSISKPYENLDGHQITTSPSIGIAVYPRDGSDIDSLLLNADAAMYKSKKAGRGRYSFFDASLNKVSIQKFKLEQRMPSAMTNDEFVLHYQPKVRLVDYRVIGLEALIRWQHPEELLIYPNDFVDLAEKSGLITQLGTWVLAEACRQVITWQTDGLEPIPVALNVSPLELHHADYASKFIKTIDHFNVSPKLLEIEVTESAFIEDREIVAENLTILAENGINISLDDFGKGFSNLENVRSLPINTIKIDRSFIKDIRNNYNDNSIVYSTIALAQRLKLKVIAEGVETQDQLRNLKVAGCDQVQGYYFSRPVPDDKIREFIISPIRSPLI